MQVGRLSVTAGGVAALGAAVALFGTYWDDAWHTDRGRDSFFVAPHLVLYGGVLVSGLVVASWLLASWRGAGGGAAALAALARRPAALLAATGAGLVLLSAPVDNVWHDVYGRDAVLWSPPHMLAVTASVALSAGLLAGLASRQGRAATAVQVALAAGVLGALLVPVLEFDSDVPQFAAWTYWPVTTAGVVLALLLVRDLVPGRWVGTAVAGAFTLFKLGVVAGLAALDHTGALVPPVLVVAVLDDLLAARGHAVSTRALATGAAVPATWAAAVAVQPGVATAVPLDDVPLGLVASLLAAGAVMVLTGRARGRVARSAPVAAALALVVVLPVVDQRPAQAHDPGQGPVRGEVAFVVVRTPAEVAVEAMLQPRATQCDSLRPVALVARRAGEQRSALLQRNGCLVSGELSLPDEGRWFLYVQVDRVESDGPSQRWESWVPLAGAQARVADVRDLYEDVTAERRAGAVQVLSGAALYAVVVLLLVSTVRLAERAGQASAVGRAR